MNKNNVKTLRKPYELKLFIAKTKYNRCENRHIIEYNFDVIFKIS